MPTDHDLPPPWIAFPNLDPASLPARQGAEELYFLHDFWPFWRTLDGAGRTAYLEHWNATPLWREAIRTCDPDWLTAEMDEDEGPPA
ncbi:MAG: hypothetical protein AAF638_03900 [Pseudomonadota bacterium]